VKPAELPKGTVLTVFACGTSARTAELRGFVDRLKASSPKVHGSCLGELSEIAHAAAAAVRASDRRALIDAIRHASLSLARLGEAASAPIVPAGWGSLGDAAAAEGAAFCVAGAGGGDVAAFVGSARPTEAFLTQARTQGLFVLDVEVDEKGVRTVSQSAAHAAAAPQLFSSSSS
jgi:phosphomevalonate kinase